MKAAADLHLVEQLARRDGQAEDILAQGLVDPDRALPAAVRLAAPRRSVGRAVLLRRHRPPVP
jgi:hypothetical protein